MKKQFITRIGLIIMILLLLGSGFAIGQEEKPLKKVLVLHSDEQFIPANVSIDDALVKVFSQNPNFQISIFSEYLDANRFDSLAVNQQNRVLFKAKYEALKPDVIIAVDYKAFDFLQSASPKLYQETPVVFCMLPEGKLDINQIGKNITGNYMNIDGFETAQIIKQIHPDVKEIFVIFGNSAADASKEEDVRADLMAFDPAVKITFLKNMTFEALADKLAGLPENTAVIFGSLFQDSAGKAFIPREALKQLNARTAAPIYGIFYTNLNYGLVGGSLFEFTEVAKDAGQRALNIMSGKSPSEIPILKVSNKTYFDWNELQRWHIDESRLPENYVLINKERTLWDEYRVQIIGLLIFFVVETLLVVFLVTQLALRRKADAQVRQLNEDLEEKVIQRTAQLNLAQKKLLTIEKQEAVNHLIRNLLHRINTPLGNTLSYIDLFEINLQSTAGKEAAPEDYQEWQTILRHLKGNQQTIKSTMENLKNMLDVDSEEGFTSVNLEEQIQWILYDMQVLPQHSGELPMVLVCYPEGAVPLQVGNFKKAIYSLIDFAKSIRMANPALQPAELIFELRETELIFYYKDKVIETVEHLDKLFTPYGYNAFGTEDIGLELAVFYNCVTTGMNGYAKITEDPDGVYSHVIKVKLPLFKE